MNQYLSDTEFASRSLIELANHELIELKDHAGRLALLEKALKVQRIDFESADIHEDFSDVYVNLAYVRMMRTRDNMAALQRDIAVVEQTLMDKELSLQALFGAILQIAKQGISSVHEHLDKCPNGREVGGVALKDVIWQGRNQAIHSEEGNFRQPVIHVFTRLEKAFGSEYSLAAHAGKSRARQIVSLLGWTGYSEYLKDMWTLLP